MKYDYICYPDGRSGEYGGTLTDRGTALQGLQWAIDNCPSAGSILLAPGTFSLNGTPLLRNNSLIGSVAYKSLYVWDGASMSFAYRENYPVPASKLVSTVNNINSYILRRNDSTGPITLANLELDGGISAEDAVQSRALFGGVGLYNSENTTIESCYIHHVTHTGVYAAHRSDPKTYSAIVRNCEIGYCGLRYDKSYREYGTGVAGGGGGWDTGASSILVENNYIHHCSMSAVNCEPGRNWLVQDNWLGCPWVYGLSESDKNKAPWTITVRDWKGQASTGNVHRHNYVQTETGWGVVYNNKCKGNTCKDNVIRHLRGAIVASGGASLDDQIISGNSTSGALIPYPSSPPTAVAPNGYTVTKDGDVYVAKDRAGTVLTSGQDAAAVINAALNALTSGRTSKEKVRVEASAILSKRIEMPSYAVLECADGVVLKGAGNNQLVGSKGTHDWEVRGGEWVCTYKEAKSSASPMVFSAPLNCLVIGAKARDSLWNNIIVDNADGMVFRGVESYHSWAVDPKNINATGWSGIIFLLNAKNCLVEDCFLHDCGHGGCYFYSNEEGQTGALNGNVMRNNRVERCGTSGLSISQRSTVAEGDNNIIEGNTITDCGMDGDHPHINIGFYTSPNPPARGNIVRNNTIVDTNGYADQGIIDQGQGTEIYGNDIQGVRAPIVLLRAEGSKVRDNNIHGSSGTAIMGSATNAVIRDNIITDTKGTVNVTGAGNVIENNGPRIEAPVTETAKEGGINDAVLLLNLIKGGAAARYNKCFGSTGNANDGSETELVPPDGTEWTYACIYMNGLQEQGYEDLRIGFHDWQTTRAGMDAGAVVVAEKAQLLLDAAGIYGIGVVLVIGGLSDKSTAEQGFGLFDRDSALYKAFVLYAASIADALYGSKLRLLELINEADFITCVEKHWRSRSLAEFVAWAAQLVADVKAAQRRPGVPIGMGTAVDSTIHGMEWLREISGDTKVIDSMVGMCDVISVHSYVGERGATYFDTWKNEKVPAIVAAAKRLGKDLIFGETGRLYEGGTYDAAMDAVLQASGATYLWMVRRHDPKVYTIPAIPERPSHDTPASEPSTDSSSDTPETPQEPAQETPEAGEDVKPDENGAEPTTPDEPSGTGNSGTDGGEPNNEPPPVTGPADDGPDAPVTGPGPVPLIKRNLIMLMIEWLKKIFGR